jgi:hypothetical protein
MVSMPRPRALHFVAGVVDDERIVAEPPMRMSAPAPPSSRLLPALPRLLFAVGARRVEVVGAGAA